MTVTECFGSKMECDTELFLIFLSRVGVAPGVRVGPAEKQLDILGCSVRGLWGSDQEADDSITF